MLSYSKYKYCCISELLRAESQIPPPHPRQSILTSNNKDVIRLDNSMGQDSPGGFVSAPLLWCLSWGKRDGWMLPFTDMPGAWSEVERLGSAGVLRQSSWKRSLQTAWQGWGSGRGSVSGEQAFPEQKENTAGLFCFSLWSVPAAPTRSSINQSSQARSDVRGRNIEPASQW